MLVLALLATLAAVSWPALRQSIDDLRLRRAADQVRSAWASARNHAVATGRIVAFRCQAGESRYRVVPFEGEEVGGGAAATGLRGHVTVRAGEDGGRETVQPDREATNLPQGITIAATRFRDEPAVGSPRGLRATAESATDPILFFADGTGSDCLLTLVDERGWHIRLALRAITGSSSASALLAPEASNRGLEGSRSR